MNLNLALVNAKRSSFDVSDVKFIYKKLGEKDRNANYRLLKIIWKVVYFTYLTRVLRLRIQTSLGIQRPVFRELWS